MRRTVRPKLVSLHDGIIDLAENSGHYDESNGKFLSANDHPIKSSDSKQKIGNPMKQVLCEAATQKGKCIRPEFAHILRTCHDMRHFVRLYIDGWHALYAVCLDSLNEKDEKMVKICKDQILQDSPHAPQVLGRHCGWSKSRCNQHWACPGAPIALQAAKRGERTKKQCLFMVCWSGLRTSPIQTVLKIAWAYYSLRTLAEAWALKELFDAVWRVEGLAFLHLRWSKSIPSAEKEQSNAWPDSYWECIQGLSWQKVKTCRVLNWKRKHRNRPQHY